MAYVSGGSGGGQGPGGQQQQNFNNFQNHPPDNLHQQLQETLLQQVQQQATASAQQHHQQQHPQHAQQLQQPVANGLIQQLLAQALLSGVGSQTPNPTQQIHQPQPMQPKANTIGLLNALQNQVLLQQLLQQQQAAAQQQAVQQQAAQQQQQLAAAAAAEQQRAAAAAAVAQQQQQAAATAQQQQLQQQQQQLQQQQQQQQQAAQQQSQQHLINAYNMNPMYYNLAQLAALQQITASASQVNGQQNASPHQQAAAIIAAQQLQQQQQSLPQQQPVVQQKTLQQHQQNVHQPRQVQTPQQVPQQHQSQHVLQQHVHQVHQAHSQQQQQQTQHLQLQQPPQQQSVFDAQVNHQQRLIDALWNEQSVHATTNAAVQAAFALAARRQQQEQLHQVELASAERNLSDTTSVQDHISRLISENEAIVQPNQVLLKRRPYHRQQVGAQSSIDHDSNSGDETRPDAYLSIPSGSNRTSPSGSFRDHRAQTTRSQSLYEPLIGAKAFAGGGSLTSGQPLIRLDKTPGSSTALTCSYCNLSFNNQSAQLAHEPRCSKRLEVQRPPASQSVQQIAKEELKSESPRVTDSPSVSDNRHPLKRRLLAAAYGDHLNNKQPKVEARDSPVVLMDETNSSSASIRIPEPRIVRPHASSIPSGLSRRATIATLNVEAMHSSQPSSSNTSAVVPSNSTISPSPVQTTMLNIEEKQQIENKLSNPLLSTPEQNSILTLSSSLAAIQAIQNYQQVFHPVSQASNATLTVPAGTNQSTASNFPSTSNTIPTVQQQTSQHPLSLNVGSATQTISTDVFKKEFSPFAITEECVGNLDKPYTLMLDPSVKTPGPDQAAIRRESATRLSCSESYVCMLRPQPMFVEQKGVLSMYSNWQQAPINEVEAKLNYIYMSACALHPRTGMKPYWRYSTAMKDNGMRVTHSSFWTVSPTRMRYRDQHAHTSLGISNGLLEAGARRPSLDSPATVIVPELVIACPQEPSQVKTREPSPEPFTLTEIHESAVVEETSGIPEPLPIVQSVLTAQPVRCDLNDVEMKLVEMRPKSTEKTEPTEKIQKTAADLKKEKFADSKETLRRDCAIDFTGGFRSDEVYVYVRGRGRGRYVCERCGIRCKKPSMLKKHIKSHTDVRPFKCSQCNFCFKTKGNLTKHLSSKAHKRRIAEGNGIVEEDSDEEDRLEIASPDGEEETPHPFDDMDAGSSDDEDHFPQHENMEKFPYRKFGQENILLERSTHTPPSRWMLVEEEPKNQWPEPNERRNCSSAPPSAMMSPLTAAQEATIYANAATARKPEIPPPLNPMFNTQSTAILTPHFLGPSFQQQLGFPETSTCSTNGAPSVFIGQYLSKEEHPCTQCDRVFRKAAELTLHQHAHNIERQNAKNRVFQCPECRMPYRSKALLQKHLESAHGMQMNAESEALSIVDPTASTQAVLGTAPIASNPRSFLCTDCNIGFRKHGILAKHLRSKTHVMKLESNRRLPEDSLNLIMKKDNGACLNDIDTTDCDKARSSLMTIVENIRLEFVNEASALNLLNFVEKEETPSLSSPVTAVSFAPTITTSLPVAPSPSASSAMSPTSAKRISVTSPLFPSVSPKQKRDDLTPMIRPRGESFVGTPSTSEYVQRRRCDSFGAATFRRFDDSSSARTVSANVWIPPRLDGTERPRVLVAWSKASTPSDTHLEPGSQKSDEPDSSAERSAASTPVCRGSNGHAPSPLIGTGKCSVCDLQFENPTDLQVHIHCDHICIRDGNDFKCPKKHCEKVYPNRHNLRSHIASHYTRPVVTPIPIVPIEGVEPNPRASPFTDGTESSCQSPVSMDALRICEAASADQQPSILPCAICGARFSDAMALQDHWLSHVTKRPHVCVICDAGFTTQDALNAHTITHNGASASNGVSRSH